METQDNKDKQKYKQEQEEYNKQRKSNYEPDLKKVEQLEILDI